MSNTKLVNKILCSLPRSWELKVTTILKANDLTMLKLEQLIVLLTPHDMMNFIYENKKNKGLFLKASTHENDGDRDDDEDEEVAYSLSSLNDFLS